MSTSPTLVTPVLGAATATSLNGLTVSSTTGTLTLANGSTLATSGANSLTMTTTGATNVTFPTSGTLATTAGTVASFSAGSTGFTPSTATTGAVTLAGTLATTNGGTGLTSFTANGVVYASSTSALATGSALTFDGTNLGVGGGGDPFGRFYGRSVGLSSASSAFLEINAATGNSSGIDFGVNASRTAGITSNTTETNFTTLGATPLLFGIGGTEQMRLTSSGLEVKQSQLIGYSSYAGIGTNGLAVAGNVGIGTSSPLSPLDVVVGAGGERRILLNYDDSLITIKGASNTANPETLRLVADNIRFNTGITGSGTERMRLDSSGNLGIGTSSPSYLLHVYGNSNVASISAAIQNAGTSDVGLRFIRGSTGLGFIGNGSFIVSGGSSTDWGLMATNNMLFAINASEKMRLDSSGNLGLGVTPSAWSGGPANEIRGLSLWANATNGGYSVQNAFYNGSNWIYKTTSQASYYLQGTGIHSWFTAPSGTAGDPITGANAFVQVMTVSSDGTFRVKGAGTAGSTDAFQVSGSAPADAARIDSSGNFLLGGTVAANSTGGMTITVGAGGSASTPLALRNPGTTNGSGVQLSFRGSTNIGAENDYAYIGMVADDTTAKTGSIRFSTANGSSPTERARISSDGTFRVKGAGTAGSTDAFQVSGSAPADAARITSGGDLLVGATSAILSERINITGSVASFLGRVRNSNATPSGWLVDYTTATPNGTGNQFLYCSDATALRAEIRSNGGLANYSANDVNLSDRREKTNFAPAKSYLDAICAIPVQTFNYIDQSEDDPGLTLGVVAQDVQAVAPELVMESNWGTAEEPKQRLSIYQTDLQYALMKCVQELKAQNDELRARVAALEA
jgi:hypothetical protein